MRKASIERLFDYSNKHCPKCIRTLPPIRLTGKREFRIYWWYEQFEQSCECGFERGGWRKVHISKLVQPKKDEIARKDDTSIELEGPVFNPRKGVPRE